MLVYRTFIVQAPSFSPFPIRTFLYHCNDGLGNESWWIQNGLKGNTLEEISAAHAEAIIKVNTDLHGS